MVSAIAQYGTNIYLARLLPVEETSAYWLATTLVSLTVYLAGLGYQAGAIRFLPAYFEEGDFDRARGFIRQLVLATIVAPLLLSVWVVLGAVVWASIGTGPESSLVAAACGLMLPMCLMAGLSEIVRATHRPAQSLVVPSLIVPLVLLSSVIVLGRVARLHAEGVLLLSIATYAAGCLIQALVVWRLPEIAKVRQAVPIYSTREWLSRCLGLGAFGLTWNMSQTADFLLAGSTLPPADVAIYGAAVKVLAAQHLVSSTLVVAAGSHLAAKLVQRDPALRAEVTNLTILLCAGMLISTILLIAFGKPVLELFGPRFADGYQVLCTLSAGLTFRYLFGPCEMLLIYGDKEREVVAASIGASLMTVAFGLILAKAFGPLGISLGSVAAFSIAWIYLYHRARALVGFDPSVFGLLLRAIRGNI